MGQQSVLLQAKGLHTFKNQLSLIPEGALQEAVNIIIDRDGVIEQRRGISQYTSAFASKNKQLFQYKNRLLTHFGTSLAFETDALNGTFTSFAGSYSEVEANRRIRGIESNGNFFFTTSEGVKKISTSMAFPFTAASGYITDAGIAKALDGTAILDTGSPGFLLGYSKVAYRIVWGYTDNNGNLILGSPSSRMVVENRNSLDSGIVNLTAPIPPSLDDIRYFYQIYRTSIITGANLTELDVLDPGEEFNLIFEEFITTTDITNGEITTTDITPESIRSTGTPLYTNPASGEGSSQTNDPPPYAKDIETYKGYTLYANTSTRYYSDISLLSISSISSGDNFFISDGVTTNTYQFRGDFETYTATFLPATKALLDGQYFVIQCYDGYSNHNTYKVWFDNTGSTTEPTLTGSISIKVDTTATPDTAADIAQEVLDSIDLGSTDFNITRALGVLTIECANNGDVPTNAHNGTVTNFTVTQDGNGIGEDTATGKIFLPKIPGIGQYGPTTSQQLDQAAKSIVRVVNANSSGLVDAYYLSNSETVPGQFYFELRDLTGNAFYTYVDTSTQAASFTPTLGNVADNTETSILSTNEVKPNRIYYSKFQIPEAVPSLNYLDIGSQDQAIQRIVAIRDSLMIFKEDGIYRLSGDIAPFSTSPFDFSLILHAPDSAVVLNNQIFAFTTQGIAQITDTGVSIISRDIENILIDISRNSNFKAQSFAVSYESDRSYLLFTTDEVNDTVPTQCLRYNTFTRTWVKWDISKSCGLVNRRDDKLYLGAQDTFIIEKERKSLDRTDHADRQYTKQVVLGGVDGVNLTFSSLSNVDVGDGIIQTQYLTIAQFNRVLNQLDMDPGVPSNNYYSLLNIQPGDNLTAKVVALATKLDTDSLGFTNYLASITGSSGFQNNQSDFNIIVNKLNLDSVVYFSNYSLSSGTIPVEAKILSFNEVVTNTVILDNAFPFLQGVLELYKSIPVNILYAPQTFGAVSMFKQINSGTFMFESNNFTLATLGYKTDLSPFLETIEFEAAGIGDWGQFNWGNQNWGGVAAPIPIRTIVPRQKQRCRFIQPYFSHSVALEKWSLFGISMNVRAYSDRAYR